MNKKIELQKVYSIDLPEFSQKGILFSSCRKLDSLLPFLSRIYVHAIILARFVVRGKVNSASEFGMLINYNTRLEIGI
jgi:hypothetical protein